MSSLVVDLPSISRPARNEFAALDSSPVTVSTLVETDQEAWDDFVRTRYRSACHRDVVFGSSDVMLALAERLHCGAGFFHTTAWCESVQTVFGHRFCGLMAKRGQRVVGVLPLCEVHSWFAPRPMLISVPYGVYGGAAAESPEVAAALFSAARELGKQMGCGLIELRSPVAQVSDAAMIDGYITFRNALPDSAGQVLGTLPRKARAAARQARERFGLRVEFGDGLLDTVWSLYSRSMRRLASINYPLAFFEQLIQRTSGQHAISVIYDGPRPIGGLVSFTFGDTFLPYFAGCAERYQHKQVNNFLYLTAMEHAAELGLRVFDFGRTRLKNRGALEFKRNQGFSPTPLQYQRIRLTDDAVPDLTPSRPLFQWGRAIWKTMPLALTRPIGGLLARHIPG